MMVFDDDLKTVRHEEFIDCCQIGNSEILERIMSQYVGDMVSGIVEDSKVYTKV